MAQARWINSNPINYLEKKQAISEANNVMEHALKTIADLFKNIQADYLSLVDNNEQLELSVNQLSEKKDECAVCSKKLIREDESLNSSKIKEKNEDSVSTYHDAETLGIIESTQIEERVLTKPKIRYMDKRSSLQITENKPINLSTSVNTQLKSKRQSHTAKVSSEIIILASNTISQHEKDVLQPVDKKNDENIAKNQIIDVEFNSEYLDIDATLFEQPFSQEQSLDRKSPISCVADDIETVKENSEEPLRTKSFLDDVVEVSPKKNVLRKKNWLRHNRRTAKSHGNHPCLDLAGPSNADNNNGEVFTPKSLKYITSKKKDEEAIEHVAKMETKPRTPSTKTNISSPRTNNKKVSSTPINDLAFFSLPPTAITATAIVSKSNSQKATEEDKKDTAIKKTLTKTQSTEPISDETYFAVDETYFPGHEISPKANSKIKDKGTVNKAKRKFSEVGASSEMEKNIDPTSTELELEIGDMSDWDTDISCDKWSSTTPQKRVLVNSFDMVPAKKEVVPKFATKGPVVRNKLEREKLRGWDCENCAQYYDNMGLSEKELAERKNLCSRHRSKFNERYYTPPGLWDLRFPDTQSSSQE